MFILLVEASNIIEELNLIICAPLSISNKNWSLNSNITVIEKPGDINLSSIDCVMTDVFVSMNDTDSLEKQSILKPYCVTADLMAKTNLNSVFMHCLPAKIGSEVNEDVFQGEKSIVG